jgi:hypothetical protein
MMVSLSSMLARPPRLPHLAALQAAPRSAAVSVSRNVEISSFQTYISIRAFQERNTEPEIEGSPWLDLIGTMDEPIKGARDITIHVQIIDKYQVGTARPPSVGAVIQVRPAISVVVALIEGEFNRVWALAIAGHLKHAHVALTEPHYRSALVTSVMFSNGPIE